MSGAAREHWTSRAGFVFAAVGSAVGLGNMWRFSYLTAEKGGAAFVALYVVFTVVVGLPVLLAELVIGRGSQKSPMAALAHFGGARWRPLGLVFVVSGFVILSYYSVIAGWTLRYAGAALLGFGGDSGEYFQSIREGWAAFGFHLLFMVATVGIVAGGVRGGIERAATLMMPALFILVCGIALYAAPLPGAAEGYRYYLNLNVTNALSRDVVTAAAGQAFFSLSLGMGAMLTFGSYLDRNHHLPNESLIVAGADAAVAFVAGLMVFPLIFALGLSQDVGESTLGALFVTLPRAFAEMGAAGHLVGFGFFLALIVGALTSAMSLLEVVVSSAIDTLGWSRRQAALVAGAAIAAVGIPSAWSVEFLGVMDEIANNVLLLGGGLALAVFTGWFMKDPEGHAAEGAEGVRWFFLWRLLLRFVVPAVLLYVLLDAVPRTFRAVAGLVGGG